MINLGSLLEVYLTTHFLLGLGSLFVGNFPLQSHSNLKLSRILFVACLLSPVVVKMVGLPVKPMFTNFVSLDVDEFSRITADNVLVESQNQISQRDSVTHFFQDLNIMHWIMTFIVGLILYRGAYFVRDLFRIHRLLRDSHLMRSFQNLRLHVSTHCKVPFSLYWCGKSFIVLPVAIVSSKEDLRIAVAHEGQHHRQGDCIFAYVVELVSILFFGNPFVPKWVRKFNELQEFTCDETLVGRQIVAPHVYGRCLLKVAQMASQQLSQNHREFACAVGMTQACGNNQSSILERRIVMLFKYQVSRPSRKFLKLLLTPILVIFPLAFAYASHGTFANESEDIVDEASIDPRIQKIAEQEIAAAVGRYKARSGVVVVADPKNGKILAFAERRAEEKSESWKSRVFVPASTLKPFIAAAAFQNGVATESKTYDCRGPYFVDGVAFNNHDSAFGKMSVTDAISKSANVCMIKIAQDTGFATVKKQLSQFGFDIDTLRPSSSSESLHLATVAALGEKVPVTFDSLVKAYSILANKGRLPNDHVVVSESTAASVERTLASVVEHGTAKKAAISGIKVAGKTGTLVEYAGVKSDGTAKIARQFGMFVGYAPVSSPRYVSLVIIETDGPSMVESRIGSGGQLAAPVFKEVVGKSLDLPLD